MSSLVSMFMTLPDVLIPIRKSDGDFFIIEAMPSELDWPELRWLWDEASIKLPYCFAPPEEKMELIFSYACKKVQLPISIGTVFNPSWSEMFLNKIGHDCLLISSTVAPYVAQQKLFKTILQNLRLLIVVDMDLQEATSKQLGSQPLIEKLKQLAPELKICSLLNPYANFMQKAYLDHDHS